MRGSSHGVWYVAVFFVSLSLLTIMAWDGLRGRSPDHRLALDPPNVPRAPGNSGPPGSPITETRQSAVDPSPLPADRTAAFATQLATPTPPAPVVIPPPAVSMAAPDVPAIAPWLSATVTTTFTRLGRLSVASPGDDGKRSQNCLAVWDRGTHMTKEEWKAACERARRNP